MASGKRMSRLLQGDVGSGKTLVAAALLWAAQRAGYQSAFMAPMEILAQQHGKTLQGFLAPFGIRVCLLTGSMKAKEKSAVKAALEEGVCDVAVGTHALLTEDVRISQSRVLPSRTSSTASAWSSAAALSAKRARSRTSAGHVRHAHPAHARADDLRRSRSFPCWTSCRRHARTVDTFAVTESYRARLNGFIRKQVEEGHQVFVVCPR